METTQSRKIEMNFEKLISSLDLQNRQFCLDVPLINLHLKAIRKYYPDLKRILSSYLVLPTIRDRNLVSSQYEKIWEIDNKNYVEVRDNRRDVFLVGKRPIYTNGWFIIKSYTELLLNVINQLGAESILEVGSGRGNNLSLLALRRPDIRFYGLELTHAGVKASKDLVENLPQKYLTVAGFNVITAKQKEALRTIQFFQASALQMPFPDNSFDSSFTCLVLEQMPHYYVQALQEMRRVTRKYCVFIEPFAEANNVFGLAYLRSVDYFRASYKCFAELGLEPVYFTTAFPQKLRFKVGLLIARIVE
jgi:SAM-dependent methyltransferase